MCKSVENRKHIVFIIPNKKPENPISGFLFTETEVLCTSLIDIQKYTKEEFKELYHYRWNEEEAYKLLKARAELEAFSEKTARAGKQDFYAKIFMLTMCTAYVHPIKEKVRGRI